MESDLVAFVRYHAAFFGKRLERVSGYEPCRRDVVLVEQLQQATHSDCAGEETARYVACRVLASIGSQPGYT